MNNVKISDYCKDCAFLCKTDKEYCPNKLSHYEAHKKAHLANIERMKKIDNLIKEENNKCQF